jgi:hypothetical protein
MKGLLATCCLLWCSLTFAAPPKAAPRKASVQSVKPPNPNGRKGGEAHQAKVDEVAADVEARGLKAEREHMVPTPGGAKSKRFVDVAGVDETTEKVEEMHQVGRQNKDGQPVSRERKAMDDIEKASGKRPKFHAYD